MAPSDMLQERIRAVTKLWRQALTAPSHRVGCACFGAFLVPAPSAQNLEEDLLDYLRHRYQASGDSTVLALLARREQEVKTGNAPEFQKFLLALGEGLEAELCGRLLEDIANTLSSFGPGPSTSTRLSCS